MQEIATKANAFYLRDINISTMADLLVKNGRIVGPALIQEANIVVQNGKITQITKQKVDAEAEIDAQGMYIIPGLIDAHVHLREPGNENKEDWRTGTQAAAAGGITTVLDMPNNSPPINTAERLQAKRELASQKSLVNFGLYFGADNNNLEEIKKISNVAGVKFFLGKSTGDLVFKAENLSKFFKVLKEKKLLAACHCEDAELLRKYNKDKFEHFTDIRPPLCEARAIRDVVKSMHNNRVHICHVSSELGLGEIMRAKRVCPTLTCEVTPHHLFLSEDDEKAKGSLLKTYPPLRSKKDCGALWKGLSERVIDIVATDHAPHLREEKEVSFMEAPGGVPGLETMLPLMLGTIDLRGLVEFCSKRPAEIFNIRGKGAIIEGNDADFVILDKRKEYKITSDHLFTKCKWTPYEGMKVKGKVEATFVGGNQVFDGEQTIDNLGKEVKFA